MNIDYWTAAVVTAMVIVTLVLLLMLAVVAVFVVIGLIVDEMEVLDYPDSLHDAFPDDDTRHKP